jgi:hyperosmotically inducible periplasmic protein
VHWPQRMKSTLVSNAALLSQLVLLSAGLTLAGPALAGQANQPPETASTAKLNKADRDLTQQIRKAIVSDKSLSTQAHNVKILARDGTVTLKGQVKTDEEKKAIEDKAASVAGAGKVTSELTVGPNTSKKS